MKESDRVGVGRAAQALLGSDNASSAVERGDRVFVPVIFPELSWFQDFNATIRNIVCTIVHVIATAVPQL